MDSDSVLGYDIGKSVRVINESSARFGQIGTIVNVLHVCEAYWSVHVRFKDQSEHGTPLAYSPGNLEIVH